MVKKIAILGGGMTGLLIADTLTRNGKMNFDIFEKEKQVPNPSGFMVMHYNFGLKMNRVVFPVYQKGEEANYKAKLNYHDNVNCSWKSGLRKYYLAGYNPHIAAERMFKWYESRMVEERVTPESFQHIQKDYDLVLSTIPPFYLVPEIEHSCVSTNVYIETLEVPEDETVGVLYNGFMDEPVLREVNLWGRWLKEYNQKIPEKELIKVEKPTHIIKEVNHLLPDNVILLGRRGQWNKHIMLHHVYFQVEHLIKEGVIR